eukprot:6990440-Pyramimonas_sp.AAC.1
MLPSEQGSSWSQCTRRVARDQDAGSLFDDVPLSESTGRERRRIFKGNPRNIVAVSTCGAMGDARPR